MRNGSILAGNDVSEIEGPATRRALARLLAESDAFESAWGREALHARASELPRGFDDLFDLSAVDELLSRRALRTPFLRLAKEGSIIPPARFTRSGGVGAEIADQVDDAAVARLFADGATIVLQALHRTWPPIGDFARELAAELGHPVQVNAYVTPPSSRGFAAHYDIHDVFVLQIAGEKRWVVHAPVLEAPLRSQPWTDRRDEVERAAAGESLLDVVLRPGDALYLPRGFVHAAEALGEVSAHLTVGIHVVTRHALLEALVSRAAENEPLRRALPAPLDLDDDALVGDELVATRSALVSFLEDLDPAAIRDALRGTLAAATRPGPVAPLRQVEASRAVWPGMRIRLRAGVDLTEAEATRIRVLLDGEAHAVNELDGDAHEVEEVVRALLRQSIVIPVD